MTKYGYDSLYRLTSWTDASGAVTQYGYDGVGNRLSVIGPSGTINYTYDPADQLLTAGLSTFSYDGNGSQISKTTGGTAVNYGWDPLNRLISVTGGAVSTQYAYDGDGNRVSQQISSGTYQYVNDPVTALPVVLDENGPDGAVDYVPPPLFLSFCGRWSRPGNRAPFLDVCRENRGPVFRTSIVPQSGCGEGTQGTRSSHIGARRAVVD